MQKSEKVTSKTANEARRSQSQATASPWFTVDSEYRIVATNQVMNQMLGRTFDQLHYQKCADMVPWCTYAQACCPLLGSVSGNASGSMVCSLQTNAQTEQSNTYKTIGLSFASPLNTVDLLTNEIQEQLEQLRQQSQIYLDIAGVIVVHLSVQGIVVSANKKACETLGVPEDALVGKNWFETWVPLSIRNEVKGMFYSLLTQQSQTAFKYHETEVVNANGELRHIVFTGHLLYNTDGLVSRVMLSGVDVSGQRIAEYENVRLQEHTDMLISIIHEAPQSVDMLLETTVEALLYFSESAYSCIVLFDESEASIRKQVWSKSIPHKLRPVVFEYVINDCLQNIIHRRKALIENSVSNHVSDDILPKLYLPHRLMTIPVVLYNKVVAVMVVANKETNYTLCDLRQLSLLIDTVWLQIGKIQAIDTLRHTEEQLRQSERLKAIFLANISHEIRTPMNAILGFSQLLAMPTVNPERRGHFVEQINIGCSQLLNTINDLIEIAKIETGQITINETVVSITSIIDELRDSFQKQCLDKKIDLFLDNFIPVSRSTIRVDVVKLVQIISNLLHNAIKFTGKGFVRCGCSLEDGEILFFVEDSGIGIATENHSMIFERFWQVDMGSNRRYGGIGLGLSIAKAYISLLGGRLWVTSELGIGSIFKFAIPYLPVKTIKKHTPTGGDIELPNFNAQKIVIIEDDLSSLELLSSILRDCNASVIAFKTGLDGLHYLKEKSDIVLVLIDLKLPDIDGFEVVKQLRTFGAKYSIIALTANPWVYSHDEAIAAGCTDYIAKPIVVNQLLEMIQLHVNI